MPEHGHGLPDEGRWLMWNELEGHRPPRVKPPHRPHVRGGEGRGLASLVLQELQERVGKVGAAPDANLSESFDVVNRIRGGTS